MDTSRSPHSSNAAAPQSTSAPPSRPVAAPRPSQDVPRDFARKLDAFRSHPAMRPQPGYFGLKVAPWDLFQTGCDEIMRLAPNDLKRHLVVQFEEDERVDYGGGLSREFFFHLSRYLLDSVSRYNLFKYPARGKYTRPRNPEPGDTLQINPESGDSEHRNHLEHFKFVGRALGLAIFHRHVINAPFNASLYKMILKKKLTLADLESVDADLHRSMTWMLENDITGVIDETFTITEDRFGEIFVIHLKPGAEDVPVTEENKKEYVDLMVTHRISGRVTEQFDALMSGFHDIIPQELVDVFDEHELELLVGGTPEIDVDDWARFTDYSGYDANDEVIQWFWKCMRSWPPKHRESLLQFATGSARAPFGGFADLQGHDGTQRFTIERWGSPSHLPQGHTCFNKIDLPPYEDYATLEQKLTLTASRPLHY